MITRPTWKPCISNGSDFTWGQFIGCPSRRVTLNRVLYKSGCRLNCLAAADFIPDTLVRAFIVRQLTARLARQLPSPDATGKSPPPEMPFPEVPLAEVHRRWPNSGSKAAGLAGRKW